ncbi:hypothetical protein [Fluviicola sp.]|uniref:hypothetical protein n=1 Tax=Fluviicola sp. TaxID=1917219 RepID=UPI0026104FB4|nr:hypothetical protein [Fluviicola sp.]
MNKLAERRVVIKNGRLFITPKIQESIVGFNAIWVVFHLIYFAIYYSKYSSCFHKLSSLDLLKKIDLVDKEVINSRKEIIWKKIKKLRRISYFPTLAIAILHLGSLYIFWHNEIFTQYYSSVIYMLIGGLIFILLANEIKGAKVLDDNVDSDFWI